MNTPTGDRLAGPDVVRAVALIGVVVMNYHGYLLLRSGAEPGTNWLGELFDPWTGPLATRFAATFVLVAGVGVTLMTSRAISVRDREAVRAMRWRLVRRGLALYVLGLLLDEIWPGSIIPYYGAMFALAAVMFTWRSRWLLLTGFGAALAGWRLRIWRYEQNAAGISTDWLTDHGRGSPRGNLFAVFVNGTHPLLPWLAFFCAGMVLGRVLRTTWWRNAAISVGLWLAVLAWLVSSQADSDLQKVALSTHPYDRGVLYVASALGSALVAYGCIDWFANRFPAATDPLRRAGQMTLSLYILHVLVFNLVVDWLGWVEPAGVGTALVFAVGFWIVGIVAAVAWQRRFGRGPAEQIYRAVGG